MDATAQSMNKLIREVQNFYRSLSDLLGTTERLLREEEWKTTGGSSCMYGNSASLSQPNRWFPAEVFRLYKNRSLPHSLAFVSIMLDHRPDEYEESLEQPLIAAGWFDYGKGKEVGDEWKPWYGWFHGYMDNFNGDFGVVKHMNPKAEWTAKEGADDCYFKTVQTFAWPLADITNSEMIKIKITDPLISHIRETVEQ